MPPLKLPNRLEPEKPRKPDSRECPAHRAWGRRQLVKVLSPSKTWEGAAGGLAAVPHRPRPARDPARVAAAQPRTRVLP
mgnify:CR=1 FL=1